LSAGLNLLFNLSASARPCHRCQPFQVSSFDGYIIKTIFTVGWRALPPTFLNEKLPLEMSKSLDLRSQMHFPTFTSLPEDSDIDLKSFGEEHYGVYGPVKHWCLLAEIVEPKFVEPIPYFRPMFTAKDKAGKEFLVALYLDNDVALPDFWNKYCKPGNVVAIMYACSHIFMDGQTGIRVEEVENIKMFPCNLNTLLNISDELKLLNHPSKNCQSCKKAATLKCSRCSLLYCDKDCQMRDWKEHKNKCLAFKQVIEWRERNWRKFDQYWM